MFEFADIFAYGLATTVYVYGSVAMLIGLALSAMVATRTPHPALALQGALPA